MTQPNEQPETVADVHALASKWRKEADNHDEDLHSIAASCCRAHAAELERSLAGAVPVAEVVESEAYGHVLRFPNGHDETLDALPIGTKLYTTPPPLPQPKPTGAVELPEPSRDFWDGYGNPIVAYTRDELKEYGDARESAALASRPAVGGDGSAPAVSVDVARDAIKTALEKWPDAGDAILFMSRAIGPLIPITDDDIRWANETIDDLLRITGGQSDA